MVYLFPNHLMLSDFIYTQNNTKRKVTVILEQDKNPRDSDDGIEVLAIVIPHVGNKNCHSSNSNLTFK